MTIRELYFSLIKEDNKYLNKRVILDYLCFAFNYSCDKDLFFNFDRSIDYSILKNDIGKLKNGFPIQYLVGKTNFYHNEYYINEGVLIPRVETEELVDKTISFINKKFQNKSLKILDICCGSGVIGLTLKKYFQKAKLYLSDISQNCVNLSLKNALKLNLKVNIIQSDLFSKLDSSLKFNVIISNPPYIEDENKIDLQVKKYEPSLALISKPSTFFYEKILKEGIKIVTPNFLFAFEINEDDKAKLEQFLTSNYPSLSYIFEKDMYNKDRFLFVYD